MKLFTLQRRPQRRTVLAAACALILAITTACSSAMDTDREPLAEDAASSSASAQGATTAVSNAPDADAGDPGDVNSTSETAGASGDAGDGDGDRDGEGAGSGATEPDPEIGVDALTLSGSADAVDVPDMQPVLTSPEPHFPATVTDARGTDITVNSADRVIALDLYGTLVDTIIGLGLTDRLVGRGASDTQAVLEDLPVVSTDGIGLSAEAVLSLRPDVVLTTMTIGSPQAYDQIEAAGVAVVRFDTVPSLAELPESMTRVASVFGMADQADDLIAHTEAELASAREEIAALASATPRPPRALVLYVRGTAGMFFIFGAGYGIADILTELHLDDIASKAGIEKLVPANPESLVTLDPEIILTMRAGLETGGGVPALLKRPGISATTAGEKERIITADDAQLLSYGPRTPAALVSVAKAIYEPANG